MTRERYSHQLGNLRADLQHMGGLVDQALITAIHSLEGRNTTVAAAVIDGDKQIDEAERTIEERTVHLMATQQPVAGDLRLLASVIAIASELERIGDYAVGIARRSQHFIQKATTIAPPSALHGLTLQVQHILQSSMEAFGQQNIELAQSLRQKEEQIDALQKQIRNELMEMARNDVQQLEQVIDLIDMVHMLERTADRATNIGERVIYLVTSDIADLNP
jgi:phosphate transport system protein